MRLLGRTRRSQKVLGSAHTKMQNMAALTGSRTAKRFKHILKANEIIIALCYYLIFRLSIKKLFYPGREGAIFERKKRKN